MPASPRSLSLIAARGLAAGLILCAAGLVAQPLRFFAVGDLPYFASEEQPLADLLAAAAARRPPFLVHLGDIKRGSSPCTDASLTEIAALFRAQPVPVVYTPGDNEWTDCHRASAGGLDPLVRLKRVREIFFADPDVLRMADLGVTHQGPEYPEIAFFMRSGVMLVALHLVGSNNGFDRARPEAMAEAEARTAANHALLSRALVSARVQGARALVILFQANPLFERGRGPRGFRAIKDGLVALMAEFPGPVLVLHGDTHQFRQDRPLIDPETGKPFDRLLRVEVPGSPRVGGVWISVDPDAAEPFVAEPLYAEPLRDLGGG